MLKWKHQEKRRKRTKSEAAYRISTQLAHESHLK